MVNELIRIGRVMMSMVRVWFGFAFIRALLTFVFRHLPPLRAIRILVPHIDPNRSSEIEEEESVLFHYIVRRNV